MSNHRAFMTAWHSTRLSCESQGELDRHSLRLAEHADELQARYFAARSQVIAIHNVVCRPGQPDDHDFVSCALDGIADWEAALDERKVEIESLVSALRLCVAQLEKADRPDYMRAGVEFALDAGRKALESASEPLFLMKTVDAPCAERR